MAVENEWEILLDKKFLRETFPDWVTPDVADEDLTGKFTEFGLPALASIRKDQNFDIDYFIETHPRWEGVDAVGCYGAWLSDHVREPISAPARLAVLGLPGKAFPEAFPWRDYASIKPASAANRWSALEHFIEEGFRDCGETLTYGEGAQEFLISLGRRYSKRDDQLAIKAFNLALDFGPFIFPEINRHLADAYLRSGHPVSARAIYQDLVDKGHANAWIVRNLYFSSVAMDQGACGFRALSDTAATLGDDPLWRQTLDEVIRVYFDAGLQKARSLYAQDKQSAAVSSIGDMVDHIDALLDLLPDYVEKASDVGSRVVLFVGQEDPATALFRIEQKAALIGAIGGTLSVVRGDADGFDPLLADACAVIFLETAATPQLLYWLLRVRRAGIPTFYEAYSPAFDPLLAPSPIESFAGFITGALHLDLKLNVGLRRAFASKCDYGIAPTESIARRLESITQKSKCWVLPDGITDTVDSARNGIVQNSKAATIFLESPRFLYLTPDDQSIGSAIFECLAQFESAKLAVAGYVRLDPQFDLFNDRIVEFGQIDAPGGHLAKISGPVVNLAPTVDRGDDAASASLWRLAAQRAIPSITDADGGAATGISHNVEALIACAPSEWLPNLIRLVGNSELQSQIGDQAYLRVAETRDNRKDAELGRAIFLPGKEPTSPWFRKIRRLPRYLKSLLTRSLAKPRHVILMDRSSQK